MKKLFYPMLALLTISMASCTNENEPIDNSSNSALVPVQLSAGIGEITTKAAINSGDVFSAQVVASAAAGVYSDTSLFTDGTIEIATGLGVTFTAPQYYPTDGSTIHMKAFTPRATVIDGVVSYKIDGTEDIMVTDEISGAKDDATGKSLAFKHLLTQLDVQIVAENAAAVTAWGKVTDIKIKNVPTALDLNIAAGTLAANATPAVTNLDLEGFAEKALTETAVSAGKVMLLPSSTAFTLIITTEKGGAKDVTITPTTTVASTSYTVTVTFKATQVEAKATIGAWQTGTGSAEMK